MAKSQPPIRLARVTVSPPRSVLGVFFFAGALGEAFGAALAAGAFLAAAFFAGAFLAGFLLAFFSGLSATCPPGVCTGG